MEKKTTLKEIEHRISGLEPAYALEYLNSIKDKHKINIESDTNKISSTGNMYIPTISFDCAIITTNKLIINIRAKTIFMMSSHILLKELIIDHIP
jgi:hypothetical protein